MAVTRPASEAEKSRESADSVLAELWAGNRRFRRGEAVGPRRDRSRRAAVVACSDSRVPPELLFDQGLGDLFVVRLAGNVIGADALGSLEYAAGHLDVPVIVHPGSQPLRRRDCGGPRGPRLGAQGGNPCLPSVRDRSDGRAARRPDGERREGACSPLGCRACCTVARSLRARGAGRPTVVAAYYDVATGEVERLTS